MSFKVKHILCHVKMQYKGRPQAEAVSSLRLRKVWINPFYGNTPAGFTGIISNPSNVVIIAVIELTGTTRPK